MEVNEAFATPKSDLQGRSEENTITVGVINQLKRTRPWVLFLSIVGFFLTALVAFATFGILTGMESSYMEQAESFGYFQKQATMVGAIYLIFTLIYFFSSLFLFKYAASITKLIKHGGSERLEQALKSQANFWMLAGILMLVTLLFILIPFVLLSMDLVFS